MWVMSCEQGAMSGNMWMVTKKLFKFSIFREKKLLLQKYKFDLLYTILAMLHDGISEHSSRLRSYNDKEGTWLQPRFERIYG